MQNQTPDLTSQVASALGIAETPTPEVAPEPQTPDVAQPETVVENPEQAPQQPETPAPDTENSTIRQMREQISQSKKEISQSKKEAQRANELLARIAKEQGLSVEQLEASITEKENKKRGEELGVSPEVAAQLAAQERRIQELETQNTRMNFNNRVDAFQREFKLTPEAVMEFLQTAQQQGFDVLKPDVNLSTIYRAVNFDRLSKAKEAEIRQQILNEMQQQRENGNSIPGSSAAPVTPGQDEMSDKEFKASLFNSLK